MDKHALAILQDTDNWSWSSAFLTSESESGINKFKSIAAKFLSGFISESVGLGGTLLVEFWDSIRNCHPELGRNSMLLAMSLL